MKYPQVELEILKKENKALVIALSQRDLLIQELTDQLAVKGHLKFSNEIVQRHEIAQPVPSYSDSYCLV